MADSSAVHPMDESSLIEAALDRPFEPADVPLSPALAPTPSASTSPPPPDPTPTPTSPPTEEDTWQATYDANVAEWRSQSASARTQAELTRAKWEAIRLREEEERQSQDQPPETSDESLGQHITADSKAATEIVTSSLSASITSLSSIEHVQHEEEEEKQEGEDSGEQEVQHEKVESGSPEHPWEHISSSPTSSYPSMSFPGASVPQSPSPQPALLTPAVVPKSQQNPDPQSAPARKSPSTVPSIMDNRVAPRTRTSLILSSLAINLLLPFINGVMLGFGEIFAKDVVLGWFGWRTHSGRTAANVGLRK